MQARTETNAEEYLSSILKIPLNKLEAEAQEMEKQLKASPNNPELKTKTAEANFKAGYAMMMAPELAPRVKYRGALKYFRRTLALNPTHKYAAESKQTIEAIYQQMGRPIPQ
jgi:tetratricopeptide (TPR) repeat protein